MKTRALFSLYFLMLAWIYSFWPTISTIFKGDIVSRLLGMTFVLVSLILIFQKRSALKQVAFISSQAGLFCLFFMVLVWIVAAIGHLEVLKQIAIILMIPTIVLLSCGYQVVFVLAFPLAYLFLLLPLQTENIQLLFDLVGKISVYILSLMSISAVMKDGVLAVGQNQMTVLEAIGGAHCILGWIAFGFWYANTHYQKYSIRAVFIGLCFLSLSVITVSQIVWVAHHRDATGQSTVGSIQWILSFFLALILLWIGKSLKSRDQGLVSEQGPNIEWLKTILIPKQVRWLIPTAVGFSLLMSAPWLSENIRDFYPKGPARFFLHAPIGFGQWTGPIIVKKPGWQGYFLGASATLQVEYNTKNSDGSPVYIYSAYYSAEQDFDALINPSNALFKPEVWTQTARSAQRPKIGNDNVEVIELILEAGPLKRILWYWYYSGGVNSTSPSMMQLLNNVRIISKYAGGSGVIAVSALFEDDPAIARARLESFLKDMYSSLDILERPEIKYIQPKWMSTTTP